MVKGFVPIAALALLVSPGFCQVLFERDFSGAIPGDPARARVEGGSLDYKFHQETGDHLWIRDNDGGVNYTLAPSIIDPAAHPTLYISFLLRSLNTSTKDKFAGVICYQEGREVFGAGNDYGSQQFSFWDSEGVTRTIGDVPVDVDSDVHMIVIRIDFDADGPERIRVGLDPFCRRSEARQPKHIWTTCETELDFDEIRIRCGHNDCAWEFDDLRIGTDWESVTPSDAAPGAYVTSLLTGSLPGGEAEMIQDGTARFRPAGADADAMPPSLVLESPRSSVGDLPASWALRPTFGVAEGKRFAYLDIPSDVDLYGTGEVTGSLLRNGYKITLFNKDCYNYHQADQLYQSHPWVLGVRPDGSAFGVIFDSTWIAELNLRSGILFTISDAAPAFPVIVIEGDGPQAVLSRLARLTGTMPMPPRWALGYQQCRYSYFPDARVREIASTFRAKRIPCDVIWMDIDYMDGFRIFTFDSNRFPNPRGTNDYLHSLGFKSVWMIDPGVKNEPGYAVYDSGSRADAWVKTASGDPYVGPVWPGDCVFPDFTIPAVRSWWSGLYADFMAQGVDGVWNDMNEPAVFRDETGKTMPLDNVHRGGGGLPAGPHAQYHNVYGMLMTKATREGIEQANPDKRPFVLSRANFLGGHRYAATWTGDNWASWQHLKWSVPMSLNLGLSGQPFSGPDIGGFLSDATPDLWGNWIAVGAFYPFSRAHTCAGTANQEPWEFGQEVEDAARLALQRRYRLMPYLYTVFRQAHEEGLPVMRPVFFADPTDTALRMEDQAFLVGSDVLVVPRWAQQPQLPPGIWRRVSIAGETPETDPFQCELKIRGGAIVPLGPAVQSTQEIPTRQSLTLMVVLDETGQASGTVYEDAGDGYGYRQGAYCLTTFTARKEGDRVVVRCSDQEGDLAASSRLVSIAVIDEDGVHYGFGDICGEDGVSVMPALSGGWRSRDIGEVGSAGNALGDGEAFLVTGSGADIEGAADAFRFVYRPLKGDCEVTARVVSQQDTDGWAKAGVMIRESLTADSRHAMCVMTPANGAAFQRRTAAGGATLHSGLAGVSVPQWVRVRRTGSTVTAYRSADGASWTSLGADTVPMGGAVYAGLAVTSHSDPALCTVVFDHVRFEMDPCAADLNADGRVNLAELAMIAGAWGTSRSPTQGDLNADGAVDLEDVALMLNAWLRACVQ